jgi:hypothetical protein
VNINTKPVLVLTSSEGRVDPDFPSWNFNHMIVKATTKSSSSYWMDPKVDHCKLGELPSECQGINTLVLNNVRTSQIEVIPQTSFVDNEKDINIDVSYENNNLQTMIFQLNSKAN